MLKGFTRNYPVLEMMTPQQEESIHGGAMFTMQKTGMQIEHRGALDMMADAGCDVDFEAQRVRIPSWLIEECLRKVPSQFRLKARDPKKDLMIGGDSVHFMQGMGMRYVDLDTWETRPATAVEHRDAMIVADALPNIHLAQAWEIYTDRHNIPPVMGMLENLASGIRYSSKTQVAGNIKDTEIYAIEMAKAVGTDLFPEIEHACPLTIQEGGAEAAFRYAAAGIPFVPALSVSSGATGPATLAGAVVLKIAETMAWVVMTQIHTPGAPMAIHHGISATDMRTGNKILGTPSRGVGTAMMNQMLRLYGIPIWSNTGFASTSKKIDFQAGYEKSVGTLLSSLAGGHVQMYQGGSSTELLYSSELAVMEDDVAGWIGGVLEGPIFNEETLAIDLINEVGPVPGHYMGTAHTRKWWTKEDYFPQVADYEAYASWAVTGKKDMLDNAKDKVAEILETHKPLPISDSEDQALEDILVEARKHYRSTGMITNDQWNLYMKELDSTD
jgi:trimethylamine--corrinoid protein Co-methyltransferase